MWNLWLAIWILKTAPAILFIYERMIYAIILNGIWMLFWTRLIFPHIRHKWKIHRVPAALMDLIISQPLKDVAKYLKKKTTTLFSFFFSFHNFNRFSLNFWTVNIWCRFFNVSQSRHLKWKWNINPVLATTCGAIPRKSSEAPSLQGLFNFSMNTSECLPDIIIKMIFHFAGLGYCAVILYEMVRVRMILLNYHTQTH